MDLLTIILTIFGVILTIHHFVSRGMGKLQKLGVLHEKPLPLFGNMAAALFRRRALCEVIDDIYKMGKEAKYVGLYDFGEPVVLIKSPDLIKDIAVKNFDHFVDHRGFVDANLDPLFGNNLFSLRGDKWKDIRTLLSPAFTSSKMKSMFKLMSQCGEDFAGYLAEQSATKGPQVVNSKDAFTRYTNDVIATCAFGIKIDSMRNRENEFYVLGREATNFDGILSLKFFLVRSFPRIAKLFDIKLINKKVERFFENVVTETIETRKRKGITRPDMIQLMMDSQDPNSKSAASAPKLSISDMTAQAFVFFFGGFDTTSTLMCFVAHFIAVRPQIQQRLFAEINETLTETNGELTYDSINKMEYLDALINETLRLYPVAVALDRVCVKRYELPPAFPGTKNVTLEPGQSVWFPPFSIHRDPKYFDDPETFDPERFMGTRKNGVNPFTYFPFGQGPRMCIGNRFALLETKVMLVHVLLKCHIKPSPKTVVPLEISKSSFTMSAKGGFWLQFESRDPVKN